LKSSIKDSIKLSILSKIVELEEIIYSIKQDSAPISPDCAIGRISRVDAMQNQEIREKAQKEAVIKLSTLKNKLLHIESENFGKCEICGKKIQEKRLRFMPETTKCMKCAR